MAMYFLSVFLFGIGYFLVRGAVVMKIMRDRGGNWCADMGIDDFATFSGILFAVGVAVFVSPFAIWGS